MHTRCKDFVDIPTFTGRNALLLALFPERFGFLKFLAAHHILLLLARRVTDIVSRTAIGNPLKDLSLGYLGSLVHLVTL